MKKLFVIDLYAHGYEHAMFGEAFLEYFEEYTDSKYLLNQVHSKYVKNSYNFIFNDTKIKRTFSRVINREVFKTLCFLMYIPYVFFTKRKVVILGASNLQTFMITFLLYIVRVPVSWVCHGQAESLISDNVPTKAGKLFSFSFKKLVHSKLKVKFLFLSRHILNNLPENLKSEKLFALNHPIPSSAIKNLVTQNINQPTKVAMVGLLREDKKNCNSIYKLRCNDSVELHAIGRKKSDFRVDKTTPIRFTIWDDIYTESEFNNAIQDIHGFLYFFDECQYKMTASATALDALVYGKAVFTLKNDAVCSLLEGYPYLYSYNDLSSMSDGISQFDPSTISSYKINSFTKQFIMLESSFKFRNELHDWLS